MVRIGSRITGRKEPQSIRKIPTKER